MKLTSLKPLKGKIRSQKRAGRGYGSGKGGHTVGRGQKGQKSRGKVAPLFEGGQLTFSKRLPHKRGFSSFRRKPAIANLSVFKDFKAGTVVTPKILSEKKVIRLVPRQEVKILGFGTLDKRLTFSGFKLSKKAIEKIKKAGGRVENDK